MSENISCFAKNRNNYFNQTGKVLVKKMYGVHNNEVILQEQGYSSSLKAKDVSGDIELFD